MPIRHPPEPVMEEAANVYIPNVSESSKVASPQAPIDKPSLPEPKLTNSENLQKPIQPSICMEENKVERAAERVVERAVEMKINIQAMKEDSHDSKERVEKVSPPNTAPLPKIMNVQSNDNLMQENMMKDRPISDEHKRQFRNNWPPAPGLGLRRTREQVSYEEEEIFDDLHGLFKKSEFILQKLGETIQDSKVWSIDRKIELMQKGWAKIPKVNQRELVTLKKNQFNIDLEKFDINYSHQSINRGEKKKMSLKYLRPSIIENLYEEIDMLS
jgi:hypothetical protein